MTFIPSFGRWEDREHTEKFFASQPRITMAASNILAADDDADVDITAKYEATTGRKWNSLNQNPRGFCVGFGNAKMATLALAMMAAFGEVAWPGADVAVEPVYGGMRYEIGKQKHNSSLYRSDDGGVGSWAAEWLLEYGLLLKQKYGNVDLSNYSESRCDKYGSSGVPDDIEDDAKIHPMKSMVLIDDADQAWKLLGQFNPLVHCSNQGFAMQRGKDGICRASGSWAHCAGWSGRFTTKSGTRCGRYDNSWDGSEDGSGYLGEPIVIEGKYGPINLNGNQFLVPLDVMQSMIRSGRETYAMEGVAGFAERRPLYLV